MGLMSVQENQSNVVVREEVSARRVHRDLLVLASLIVLVALLETFRGSCSMSREESRSRLCHQRSVGPSVTKRRFQRG